MAAPGMSVNLLDSDKSDNTVFTRLIEWAITYGRYIMISTEIIVLIAFISRFSLDRKLTDLREEISQKEIILRANQEFEQEFKKVQKDLERTGALIRTQYMALDTFFLIERLLLPDIIVRDFSIKADKLELKAISGTIDSFSLLLDRIRETKQFDAIELADSKKTAVNGVEFTVQMVIKPRLAQK